MSLQQKRLPDFFPRVPKNPTRFPPPHPSSFHHSTQFHRLRANMLPISGELQNRIAEYLGDTPPSQRDFREVYNEFNDSEFRMGFDELWDSYVHNFDVAEPHEKPLYFQKYIMRIWIGREVIPPSQLNLT